MLSHHHHHHPSSVPTSFKVPINLKSHQNHITLTLKLEEWEVTLWVIASATPSMASKPFSTFPNERVADRSPFPISEWDSPSNLRVQLFPLVLFSSLNQIRNRVLVTTLPLGESREWDEKGQIVSEGNKRSSFPIQFKRNQTSQITSLTFVSKWWGTWLKTKGVLSTLYNAFDPTLYNT